MITNQDLAPKYLRQDKRQTDAIPPRLTNSGLLQEFAQLLLPVLSERGLKNFALESLPQPGHPSYMCAEAPRIVTRKDLLCNHLSAHARVVGTS